MTRLWTSVMDAWTLALRAAGRSEGTIKTRVEHLRWLARDYSGRDPWSLTTDELTEWFGSHTWALATRRGVRASVVAFYRWAVATGRTAANPTAGLEPVPVTHTIQLPASEDAYHAALRAAGDRAHLMLRLAAECGMRRAEVAVVHARDLMEDLTGWSLMVHGKGSRDRIIPLPPGVALELRTWLYEHGGGYAFAGRIDGHLSPRYVGKIVARLLPDAWAMHSLRRRAGSRWYSVDHDIRSVQRLLGHASVATTQLYVTTPDEALRRIITAAAG